MPIFNGEDLNKADYIFTRAIIDNEDFLQKAISLSDEIKETLFLDLGYRNGHYFMRFLQNNFSGKEIIELFESIDTNTIESNIIPNMVKIFKSLHSSLFYDKFKKINNFSELYDEFSRLKSIEKDWLKTQPRPRIGLGLANILPINNADYVPDGII